jgi:hypothetical protein
MSRGQAPSAAKPPTTSRNPARKPLLVQRSEYAGDRACARCHQDKVESYHKTAHYKTSQFANRNSIAGTFNPGANTMKTGNANLMFRMEEKDGKFLQTAIWGVPPNERTRTRQFDLVIGSGDKGQNYLFWDDDQLFQLPVGYSIVLRQWINSPGYTDGTANFDRAIIPRCLECHAGYFEPKFSDADSNFYNRRNFVLGISCERCHGPGRGHVESYDDKNAATKGRVAPRRRPIVNPAKLSRERRADICAQCHGGQGEREILPAFSYVPGQTLENYIDLGPVDSAADVDVHGKQGKLLMKSKCFQASPEMTCSTCHDVHKPERDLAALSQHCLSCHKPEMSAAHVKVGSALTKNCIDCHMPTLESKVVSLVVNGKTIRPRFRTHWIKIYSDSERQ